MSLDQLYLARPLPSLSDYRSPIKGLYLCGSGSHPGLLLLLSFQMNIDTAVEKNIKSLDDVRRLCKMFFLDAEQDSFLFLFIKVVE